MKIKLCLDKTSKALLSDLDTLYDYYIENKDVELDAEIDHLLIAMLVSFHQVPLCHLNKVYIDKSNIEGFGVFAKEYIKKGEIVSMYPSDVVRIYHQNEYYEKCSDRTTNLNLSKYAYKTEQCVILGDSEFISDMNLVGHMINDGCHEQNCVYYPYHIFILIVASKDINKDEELLVSYGVDYWTTIKNDYFL